MKRKPHYTGVPPASRSNIIRLKTQKEMKRISACFHGQQKKPFYDKQK
jgi:hypothetical protein